jgi:magnesium transporter
MYQSAEHIAVLSVPRAAATDTVASIRVDLAANRYDIIDLVVVLDERGRYEGAADMRDVLVSEGTTTLGELVRIDWPAVTPTTDREIAADRAGKARVSALPVIDAQRRVVGCIPATTLLEILVKEHREDLHRIGGVLREREGAVHALDDPALRRVFRRMPWLLAGLGLSVIVTVIMAGYEQQLAANIAVAFFIPALVYLTDAIGTQTETIVVRALSIQHRPLRELIGRETVNGILIGGVLGLLAFGGAVVVLDDLRIAAGIGLSLLCAGLLASVLGLLLPWTLSHLGADPAFGSGPIATILQDAVTILVYFSIMGLLLG